MLDTGGVGNVDGIDGRYRGHQAARGVHRQPIHTTEGRGGDKVSRGEQHPEGKKNEKDDNMTMAITSLKLGTEGWTAAMANRATTATPRAINPGSTQQEGKGMVLLRGGLTA